MINSGSEIQFSEDGISPLDITRCQLTAKTPISEVCKPIFSISALVYKQSVAGNKIKLITENNPNRI